MSIATHTATRVDILCSMNRELYKQIQPFIEELQQYLGVEYDTGTFTSETIYVSSEEDYSGLLNAIEFAIHDHNDTSILIPEPGTRGEIVVELDD